VKEALSRSLPLSAFLLFTPQQRTKSIIRRRLFSLAHRSSPDSIYFLQASPAETSACGVPFRRMSFSFWSKCTNASGNSAAAAAASTQECKAAGRSHNCIPATLNYSLCRIVYDCEFLTKHSGDEVCVFSPVCPIFGELRVYDFSF
jgi:hypothetical protein